MTREIEQLTTRPIYENRWMSLREDQVRFPGGHEGIYTVVEKSDFATIIPLHPDGRIQLVQQYRYPVGGFFWELPQGSWETETSVDPEALALGELEEETGYKAGKMEKIGEMFAAYGFLDQTCHMFLATGLHEGQVNREATEAGMETASFTLQEVLAMIKSGEIRDSISIGVLGYWRMMGEG